jgi:hypothetical protein
MITDGAVGYITDGIRPPEAFLVNLFCRSEMTLKVQKSEQVAFET